MAFPNPAPQPAAAPGSSILAHDALRLVPPPGRGWDLEILPAGADARERSLPRGRADMTAGRGAFFGARCMTLRDTDGTLLATIHEPRSIGRGGIDILAPAAEPTEGTLRGGVQRRFRLFGLRLVGSVDGQQAEVEGSPLAGQFTITLGGRDRTASATLARQRSTRGQAATGQRAWELRMQVDAALPAEQQRAQRVLLLALALGTHELIMRDRERQART